MQQEVATSTEIRVAVSVDDVIQYLYLYDAVRPSFSLRPTLGK